MGSGLTLSYTPPSRHHDVMKDKLIVRAKLALSRGKVGEAMRLYVLAAEWDTVRHATEA